MKELVNNEIRENVATIGSGELRNNYKSDVNVRIWLWPEKQAKVCFAAKTQADRRNGYEIF